jgi:hypothetical protein
MVSTGRSACHNRLACTVGTVRQECRAEIQMSISFALWKRTVDARVSISSQRALQPLD